MLMALVLLTMAALPAGLGSAQVEEPPAVPAGSFGVLRITWTFDEEGGVFFEGALAFAEVRKQGSKRVVMSSELPARSTLRRGRYQLRSWLRSCSGNCGELDRPSNKCRAPIIVPGARTLRVVVHTRADQPCTVTTRAK